MPAILPRRRLLAASAAALPALLATAGCRSSDLFAGPDPLAGRPALSHDVITLQAVIAAEQAMIKLYQAALDGRLGVEGLAGLLAEHRQHLGRLQARLVLPPGSPSSPAAPPSASQPAPPSASQPAPPSASQLASPSASSAASPSASPGAVPARVTIARLRAAERASAADLLRRLVTVQPALAQLLASIAASDATHAAALGG